MEKWRTQHNNGTAVNIHKNHWLMGGWSGRELAGEAARAPGPPLQALLGMCMQGGGSPGHLWSFCCGEKGEHLPPAPISALSICSHYFPMVGGRKDKGMPGLEWSGFPVKFKQS